MKEQLNILQVYDYMRLGGAETHIINLARKLKDFGHNVWILASNGPGVKLIEKLGLNFIECPLGILEDQLKAIEQIDRVVKEYKIDIIHAHPFNSQIVSLLVGYIGRVPVVTTVHGKYEIPAIEEPFNRLVEKFICISEETKKFIESKRVSNNNIEVIPNSVSIIKKPNDNIFFIGNKVTITCISRLDNDKLQSILMILKSIPSLIEKINLELYIVGEGECYSSIKSLGKYINEDIGKTVIHVVGGTIDPQKYIEKSDIILGMGRVVLEALSYGKFAICIGNKYYPGIIDRDKLFEISKVNFTDRGESNLFCDKKLLEDISKIVNEFPRELKKLEETYRHVENLFCQDKSAIRHIECYNSVIANYKPKLELIGKVKTKYYLSKELTSLLDNFKGRSYKFSRAREYIVFLKPNFDDTEDIWEDVLNKFISSYTKESSITIVIRISNEFQSQIDPIINRLNDILSKHDLMIVPDILLDIEYHDDELEVSFISSVNAFIPTNKDQKQLEIKCRICNVEVINYELVGELDIKRQLIPLPPLKDIILYDEITERDERPEVPQCLAINIHTYCNAKCDMCVTTYNNMKHGIMEWELYTNIIDEFHEINGQVVTFCQHGDTFAHPDALRYIEYVVKKGLKSYIVTNGSGLTPETVDRLVNIGFNGSLVISFHGIHKGTYEKTMGLKYEKVMDNIDYANKRLRISFIRSLGHNFQHEEEKEIIQYWNERGLAVQLSDTMDWAGTLKNDNQSIKRFNNKKIKGCTQVLNQFCIDFDGEVYLCCIDMLKQVKLGNIKNDSIKGIWNGEKFNNIIDIIYGKKEYPKAFICSKCHASSVI